MDDIRVKRRVAGRGYGSRTSSYVSRAAVGRSGGDATAKPSQLKAVANHPKPPRRTLAIRLSFAQNPLSIKARRLAQRLRLHVAARWWRAMPLLARVGWGALALVMLFGVFQETIVRQSQELTYRLSADAEALVGAPKELFAQSLKLDPQTKAYEYNKGYMPSHGGLAGESARPKFSASFSTNPEQGVKVLDPMYETHVSFKPLFELATPRQNQNQLIYPVKGKDAVKVYTLKSIGFKEDIVLNSAQGDSLAFKYKLELAEGTEARMEDNGSLAIYGADPTLLGSVSTGTEKDAELLKKARQNAEKKTLIFSFPAPFVVEKGKTSSKAKAWFGLKGNELTVHATGLSGASYPLSIDPSVYIETAAKLMRGNNETNIDFDVDSELIQKGSTTGARFDDWVSTMALNAERWNGGTAAAGGFVYQVGGLSGGSATNTPVVSGQQISTQGSINTSFTMNMPASRPAGDLYIAIIAHDNSGVRVTPPSGGNWTEYADLREHAAYWKIGENKSGGNEQASYQWTSSPSTSEEWAGVIIRVTGFDPLNPVSPTPTTNSSSSNSNPVAPSITPDANFALILRAAGIDDDDPTGSWQPTGHSQVAGQRSSASTGSASFVLASMDTPPSMGSPTGTATFNGFRDTWGSSTIAINAEPSAVVTNASVYWARLNQNTKAIESHNPGDGSCTDWCTDAAYDLPDERSGFSLVAYNGFLYAIGGTNSTGVQQTTVYVAKLGANGEPARWHPTDTDKQNWVYWYPTTALSSARSYTAAVAYGNRMYLLGGLTTGNSTVTTVEYADINPMGTLSSWSSTGMASLPTARYGHTAHAYNDRIYVLGGSTSFAGAPVNTVHYIKIASNGSMDGTWQTNGSSFTTGRQTWGGSFSTVWGGYVYIMGGCSAVNGSGYCTTISNDVQLASINADGSLGFWGSIANVTNARIGHGLVAWRNAIYRIGGCATQNTTSGTCTDVTTSTDYGVINQDGDASTVSNSEPSGTAPCSGGSPINCDLPPAGDNAGQGGQMSSAIVINNGYIYVIGGCTTVADSTYECYNSGSGMSGNVSYAALNSAGQMAAPGSCGGTSYGLWCVDSTNRINGTTGVGTSSAAVFNNTIYVVGGTNGTDWQANVWSVGLNANGSLSGSWTAQTFADLALGTARGYSYAFTRANPSSAGTYPGNLFVLGGCNNGTTGNGVGCNDYFTEVYKCNIEPGGALEESDANDCTTAGQLQIDADNINSGSQGIGLMAGAVYANYVYLIGGACDQVAAYQNPTDPCAYDTSPVINNYAQRKETIYAKIDNNNNIVSASGGGWAFATGLMDPVRRRAVSFGYNGYIYSLAGYSGTASLQDLLFAKIDVSTGDIGSFSSSGVVVTPRWDLRAIVSNGYVYAIGGCGTGDAPSGCTAMQPEVQTFQLYNNDSGAPVSYSASANLFATDRMGASAAVLNGYIYVAGGCTTMAASVCTAATDNVQFASINASGAIGAWSNTTDATLPGQRAFGQLEAAGGTLYFIGGQESTATNESADVYYGTPSTSTGNVASWADAAFDLPAARTQHGATVWNNRIYVAGGLDGSAAATNTIYASPSLAAGGNIPSAWTTTGMTAFSIARSGHTLVAYANNLYVLGGFDGTNYLSDVQFAKISATDGTVGSWTYTTSLPGPIRNADGFAVNGYMYLLGGRVSASDTTCESNTIVAPISANTTIASGNNPTGIGEWYETNAKYSGNRYGASAVYNDGKIYLLGGGCGATGTLTGANRMVQTAVLSQPQVAKYSKMIDTDTDVFPTKWLLNGIDNSIGARWDMKYRTMTDNITNVCATMTTWGQETNFGAVTLGNVETYTPLDGSGTNTHCARFYYISVSIDSSRAYGYPDDVTRGPTINDLTLFFTSDPSKRLMHGRTFTGGEQQPLDTPPP